MLRKIRVLITFLVFFTASGFANECCPCPCPCCDWTGVYIGGFVGAAWGPRVSSVNLPNPFFYNGPLSWDYSLRTSWIGGGTLGFNYQWCSWLVGLENEGGYLELKGKKVDPNSFSNDFDTHAVSRIGNWYDVLALRLGFTHKCFLAYVKGGAFFTEIRGEIIDDTNDTGSIIHADGKKTLYSWALGGGLEHAFTCHWSIKAEYLYLEACKKLRVSGIASLDGLEYEWIHTFHGLQIFKLGLNYRFGSCGFGRCR